MRLTDESKQILKFLFSKLWRYGLVILVTVLIMRNCGGGKVQVVKATDTTMLKERLSKSNRIYAILEIQNNRNKEIIKMDLIKIKTQDAINKGLLAKYNALKKSIRYQIIDTTILGEVTNVCNEVIAGLTESIKLRDTVIVNQATIIKSDSISKRLAVVKFESMAQINAAELNDANIDLKLTKKRHRKQLFTGVLVGVGVGLITGLILK